MVPKDFNTYGLVSSFPIFFWTFGFLGGTWEEDAPHGYIQKPTFSKDQATFQAMCFTHGCLSPKLGQYSCTRYWEPFWQAVLPNLGYLFAFFRTSRLSEIGTGD